MGFGQYVELKHSNVPGKNRTEKVTNGNYANCFYVNQEENDQEWINNVKEAS